MESIISFIGHIRRPQCSGDPRDDAPAESSPSTGSLSQDRSRDWFTKGYVACVAQLDEVQQLRSFLDQAMALAYFVSFYGKRTSAIVADYAEELATYWNAKECEHLYKFFSTNDAFKTVVENVCSLFEYIETGVLKKTLNVDAIDLFCGAVPQLPDMPWAWTDKSAYCHLIWLNTKFGQFNGKYDEVTGDGKPLSIMTFEFGSPDGGYWGDAKNIAKLPLSTSQYPMGTSFSRRDYSLNGSIDNLKRVPLLHFIAHFRPTCLKTVEEIIGIMGSFCLNYDVDKEGVSLSQRLAARISANVLGLINLNSADGSAYPFRTRWNGDLFGLVKTFLEFETKAYGLTMNDKDIVANLFNCVASTKEQKDSAEYIRSCGGSASADQLESFKQTLGSLEALQFISQNDTLISSSIQDAKSVVAAKDDGTENKDPDEGKEGNDPDKDETEPSEDGKEDAGDDSPADDDPSEGEDDTSDGEDNPDESSGEDGTDNSTEENASGDAASSSSENDMPEEDDTPDTSDTKGFKFKVADPENETTDSVLFREEMDNFLTTVLANPPEDLSPQDVQTLTALQRYWLHLLSIKTIMGMVGSCLKHLPNSLKQLTTQCME